MQLLYVKGIKYPQIEDGCFKDLDFHRNWEKECIIDSCNLLASSVHCPEHLSKWCHSDLRVGITILMSGR